MFEPTIFPIALSDSFLTAAITEVASSGRLVPPATIVSPITASDTPIIRAMSTAPSTKNLEPKTSSPNPRIVSMTSTKVLSFFSGVGVTVQQDNRSLSLRISGQRR
jgi:hypothetical protein